MTRGPLRGLHWDPPLHEPVLVVLAGSNGAGKSTFYRQALAHTGLPLINADEIAKTLKEPDANTRAYQAMRYAETLRDDLMRRGESFIMETVRSDVVGAKLQRFSDAKRAGYCSVVYTSRSRMCRPLRPAYYSGRLKADTMFLMPN